MSVTRDGYQIEHPHKTHRSHVSGKRAGRWAQRIVDNLDKQVRRLVAELCKPTEKLNGEQGESHES